MKSGESEADRAARYAKRDVLDKLGIMPGMAVRVAGAVDTGLRDRARARAGRALSRVGAVDVVLLWPRSAAAIPGLLRLHRPAIAPAGAIWVITAKRTTARAGRPYVPDVELIPMGKAASLVDNKICSVSDRDTAMRFVIRVSER